MADLSPPKSLPLERLYCGTKVTDLAPLAGMPLKILQVQGTQVANLSPLRGGLFVRKFHRSDSLPRHAQSG